jgi:Ca2+/H+ antiporter, TMEM165/GDT1 family
MSDLSWLDSVPSLLHTGFVSSVVAVTLAEIGDKTQLLSLFLTLRFANKPALALGILLATLLNHGISAWLGTLLGTGLDAWLNADLVRWILAASFVAMAAWVLIPDSEDDEDSRFMAMGAFVATLVLFSLAEMGDKTQIATVLLAAEWQSVFWVTAGTTLGMLIANLPVVWYGERIMKVLPLALVRYLTSAAFVLMALWTILA